MGGYHQWSFISVEVTAPSGKHPLAVSHGQSLSP